MSHGRADHTGILSSTGATLLAAGALLICTPCLASEFAVTVKTATDGTVTGRLIEFSLDEGLLLQPDDAEHMGSYAARDVVEIATDHPPIPAAPGLVRVELARDDLLFGRVAGSAVDRVLLETDTLGTVEVPLERILAWKTPAATDPGARSALSGLLEHPGDEDALLLTNGDVVRGLITAIDSGGFTLETDSGESRIRHASIAAAVMVPIEPQANERPTAVIVTTDGQRLTASRLSWSGFQASTVVLGGVNLRIAGDRIARVDVLGGRWEWLASVEPISYEHIPALSLPWNWALNRNVTGGPIRVGGQQFEHGLGVHSQCSITFDLRGEYREFVTYMGLDDHSGPYASVDVEIRIDGQLRFERTAITPGRLHGPVRIDAVGAKRIKLTVLFGANADLQDRFNWVEAALIR